MSQDEYEEFLEMCQIWWHEGLVPLSHGRGYSEMLLKNHLGALSPDQLEAVEKINRFYIQAIMCHWNTVDYVKMRRAITNLKWKPLQLSEVLEEVQEQLKLKRYPGTTYIKADLKGLPPVKSISTLHIAILYLLRPYLSHSEDSYNKTEASIAANLANDSKIKITIQTTIVKKHFNFHRGFPEFLAKETIELHGSPLDNHSLDYGTEFEFTLPVWNESINP